MSRSRRGWLILVVVIAASGSFSVTATQAPKPQAPLVAPVPPGADPLSSVGLGKDKTVLVFFGSDCEPCLKSIHFYKRLSQLPMMDGIARRLIIISRAGVVPDSLALRDRQFQPHRLTSGPAAASLVTDLPTIIILDSSGKRQGVWTGILSAAKESEVEFAITGVRK